MMQHQGAVPDAILFWPGLETVAHLGPNLRRSANRRARGRSSKQGNTRQSARNRVLLFGSIRELALYRAEFLRRSGFHVLTPSNVEEAVSTIENGEFDAAILTYTLPDYLVQELAERLRQVCPDCPLITISQTGRSDRRIQPDAVVLADDGPKALLHAVRRSLGTPPN